MGVISISQSYPPPGATSVPFCLKGPCPAPTRSPDSYSKPSDNVLLARAPLPRLGNPLLTSSSVADISPHSRAIITEEVDPRTGSVYELQRAFVNISVVSVSQKLAIIHRGEELFHPQAKDSDLMVWFVGNFLSDPDSQVRAAAAGALESMVEQSASCLREAEPLTDVQVKAFHPSAFWGQVPRLFAMLREDSEAILALEAIFNYSGLSFQTIMNGGDIVENSFQVVMSADIQNEILQSLMCLHDKNPARQSAALFTLQLKIPFKLDPQSHKSFIDYLCQLLRNKNEPSVVRQSAALALSNVEGQKLEMHSPVLSALKAGIVGRGDLYFRVKCLTALCSYARSDLMPDLLALSLPLIRATSGDLQRELISHLVAVLPAYLNDPASVEAAIILRNEARSNPEIDLLVQAITQDRLGKYPTVLTRKARIALLILDPHYPDTLYQQFQGGGEQMPRALSLLTQFGNDSAGKSDSKQLVQANQQAQNYLRVITENMTSILGKVIKDLQEKDAAEYDRIQRISLGVSALTMISILVPDFDSAPGWITPEQRFALKPLVSTLKEIVRVS